MLKYLLKRFKAIKEKTKPKLNRFIYGLGIRHIGVQTAIDLANYFKTIEALSTADIDQLTGVEGIGGACSDQ